MIPIKNIRLADLNGLTGKGDLENSFSSMPIKKYSNANAGSHKNSCGMESNKHIINPKKVIHFFLLKPKKTDFL